MMDFAVSYFSPIGDLFLCADETGLKGIWFADQKHFIPACPNQFVHKTTPALQQTIAWLDAYFSKQNLPEMPCIHVSGTPFQMDVWQELMDIEMGKTKTYKEIGLAVAAKENKKKMSFQAIGQAVSKNPVSILVPCHRVIGSDGRLTGYAGGLEKKMALLKLEGHFVINDRIVTCNPQNSLLKN